MSMTPPTVYVITFPSGATLTSAIDLQRNWKTVYLEYGTFSTAANLFVQGAATSDGTFRRVYNPALNSSTVGINVFTILTAASNGYIPIPNGFRFMKIELGTFATNGLGAPSQFNLICSD